MSASSLPRTDDRAYDLRQRLNRAVRWLRDAEDIARIEMPTWPTADRIRDIYEQVSEDVLNGRKAIPPLRQRLAEMTAERDHYRETLRTAMDELAPVDELPAEELRDLVRDFREVAADRLGVSGA